MLTRQQPFSLLPRRLCFFLFRTRHYSSAARLGGGGRSRRNAARLVRTDPSPAGSAVRFIPFYTRRELAVSVRPHPRLPPARPGVAVPTAAAAASFGRPPARLHVFFSMAPAPGGNPRGADHDARGAAGPLAPRPVAFPPPALRANASRLRRFAQRRRRGNSERAFVVLLLFWARGVAVVSWPRGLPTPAVQR
jgi:hypothetical protein